MCVTVGAPVVTLCPCAQLEEGKMMERRKKIALELSDLVIYCRPVPFDEDSKNIALFLECKHSLIHTGADI